MRFKSSIRSINTFCKFTASLASLGKVAWVKLDDSLVRFTVIPDRGTQVWASLSIDQIFEEYTIQSAVPGNAINLEVNLASLNRALRSALSATSTSIRLTKKNGIPLLSLTISTTTTSSLPSAITDDSTGHNYDGFPSQSGSIGGNTFGGVGERQTVITQDVPIVVLNPSEVDGLHEPRCREPDVNIILPNLAHLKSISDRFTRLALSTTSTASINKGSRLGNDSSGGSNPRLEISANMHGNLRLAIQTDALNIVSQWDDLINPELNPNTVGGAEAIREHPSEKMRAKTGEESFARCRIDGKDWGRVLSVGRLGGRVIACFCHEHALILYVYLPNEEDGEESVLTYYVTSYSP